MYQDPFMKLVRDDVIRPDGSDGIFSVVHIKPGVSVLALDEDDNVYLAEEFHYAVRKVTIETASGGIEEGETALEAARRELKEELGIEAASWTSLGRVDPFTSSLYSPTEIFLAQKLTFGEASPEETESINLKKVSLKEAVRMVMESETTHAPSSVLILKVALMKNLGVNNPQ